MKLSKATKVVMIAINQPGVAEIHRWKDAERREATPTSIART